MPPMTLEGDTLGEKRRHFNKLVADAIADKHYELCNIRADDSDIDNLLKIDIACKTRNVDYIMEVMKSTDMLYAATAIKKSTWLITEQQYAHIINPEYLHTQLLPSMNPKSFNKLMLHIRLNLKDETRVETFYEYLKGHENAYKWLQNCSIPFTKNVIQNERLIPLSLFKRLCRRSPEFIPCYTRVIEGSVRDASKQEIMYYVKSHTNYVLDVMLHDDMCFYKNPKFSKKNTKFLMKSCPQKVFRNFDKLVNAIDLSVAARYLSKKEIKTFLKKKISNNSRYYLFMHDQLIHFIKNMPKNDRFEFVKETFINKTKLAEFYPEKKSMYLFVRFFKWYEFASFNVALPELQKLIQKEKSSSQRCAILSVLIRCARSNPQHIKTLLKLVKDEHMKEPINFKITFVNNLLSLIPIHEFDVETWEVLDQLFHSMKVYTKSDNDVQFCLQSVVLYKVLHDEPVPEIVEQKIKFDTFKEIQRKLDKKQNDKIFTYLLNSVLTKAQNQKFADEFIFNETVVHLKNALSLLKDWKKDIRKYPFVLEKTHELIKIKQDNKWKTDLSCLYNMKKSWRKHMFEESLSLSLCEETCLNALKHKPQLLARHDKEIDALRADDAVSLRRLLARLRVYWPHSLAQHWTQNYLRNLNKPTGQKAVIRGLFTLLPQNQVNDMAIKYAPDDVKINRGETNQADLSIQKYIAQNLHLARPLVSLDTVLLYAKGNHLQYAVPSLHSILDNMSEIVSREHLPKLLNEPILQKFGLYLVYLNFKSDELKSIYSEVWKTVEISSHSPAIMFRYTYERMCKVKNPIVEKELWQLLRFFMDSLFSGSTGHIEKVPISLRAEYYMKCCKLNASRRNKEYVNELIEYAPKIMDLLDTDFIDNQMLSPAGLKFCAYESKFIEIFACYVLFGKSQEDQLERFRRVVEPALGEAFQLWDSVRLGNYYIRNNFEKFIKLLVCNFKLYFCIKKIPIPVKLFLAINAKMEKDLPILQNYAVITSFKLLTEYLTIMDEDGSAHIVIEHYKFSELNITNGKMSKVMEGVWKYFHLKTSPFLGPMIVRCLKIDTATYGPTIHYLFSDALQKMFQILVFKNTFYFEYVGSVLQTLMYMLDDNDFIPSYLVVSKVIPKRCSDELKCIQSEIRNKLRSHPSKTVQLHYLTDFRNVPEDTLQVSSKLQGTKMRSCELM